MRLGNVTLLTLKERQTKKNNQTPLRQTLEHLQPFSISFAFLSISLQHTHMTLSVRNERTAPWPLESWITIMACNILYSL